MIGRTLDHYELLDVLGRGGMGVVYKARDSRLDRLVAIKVLPPATASDPDRTARFRREAAAASALNHRGIVTIYDIGSDQGADYIAMELVSGRPLSEMIAGAGLTVEEAVRIARQIADALECAHAAGIIHRDLKPANIMIAPSGTVKILDFGLAKRSSTPNGVSVDETASGLTMPGVIIGTVGYMSPQQAQGLPVDARTDIFSFGVVLYEMLTGRGPFDRESAAASLAAVLRDDPPRISGVPPALTRVLERCLQKDPQRRYASVGELLTDLDDIENTADRHTPFLAVLPFANLSSDPDNEYFCDGLSEEILNLLARTPDLRVIARTSAFAWKGKTDDIRAIGARLGVDALLEGSVRRAGERLRVNVQLVSAADGRPLWSSRYDRTLTDLFAVQDDIASEVVKALQGTLLANAPSPVLAGGAAHDAYLRGRFHWNRFTVPAMVKALELFQQAAALDPNYALAHVGVADCYLQLGHSRAGYMRPLDAFPKARAAVERALHLEPSLAEAHCSLACCLYWHDWDWHGAEREFRRAIRLNPNHATSRQWYALYLATMRRFDEAEAQIEYGLSLDPLSPLVAAYHVAVAYFARAYPSAIARFDRVAELNPEYPWGLFWLGMCYGDSGECVRATEVLQQALRVSPGMTVALGKLALYYARAGREDLARQALAQLDSFPPDHYVDPVIRAYGWIGLGDLQKALDFYEQGFEERSPLFTIVPVDPPSSRLFELPPYVNLLRRLRYPIEGMPQ
jgi:serine/threonine-protein kinase